MCYFLSPTYLFSILSLFLSSSLSGLHKGNIFHGSLSLHQLGFCRPMPAYSNHRSPVKGKVKMCCWYHGNVAYYVTADGCCDDVGKLFYKIVLSLHRPTQRGMDREMHIDGQRDWSANSHTHGLVDRLIDWLIDWSIDWLIDKMTDTQTQAHTRTHTQGHLYTHWHINFQITWRSEVVQYILRTMLYFATQINADYITLHVWYVRLFFCLCCTLINSVSICILVELCWFDQYHK